MSLPLLTAPHHSTFRAPSLAADDASPATFVLAVHAGVMAVFIAALMVFSSRALAAADMITPLSVVLITASVWMIASWRLSGGSFLDPYGLYMLAAMPFHVGFSMLRMFGREGPMLLLAQVSDAAVAQTLVLVTACFLSLHLGALVARAWPSWEIGARETVAGGGGPRVNDRDMLLVGSALIVIGIIPTVLRFRALTEAVLAGGYMEVFLRQEASVGTIDAGASILRLLAPFFLPGVMFLIAGARRSTALRWSGVFLLLAYSGAYLFIGYRAYAILPLAALLWVWHRCIRPLPVGLVGVVGVVAILMLAPVVHAFRGLSGGERLSMEAIQTAFLSRDTPILDTISEFGSSMFEVTYTTELVPLSRDFEWGMTYLRSLLHAIPIIDIPNPFGEAGSWLAWEIRPQWAARGFGFGFSFVAEAFLNFGWLGAPLFLPLVGLLIARMGVWAVRGRDPARVAFIASFLPLLLFSVRSESMILSRPILWYALIPLGLVYVLRRTRSRLAAREIAAGPGSSVHPASGSGMFDRGPAVHRTTGPGSTGPGSAVRPTAGPTWGALETQ